MPFSIWSSPFPLWAQQLFTWTLIVIAFSAVGHSYLSNFCWVTMIWRYHLLPSLYNASSWSTQAYSCTVWRDSAALWIKAHWNDQFHYASRILYSLSVLAIVCNSAQGIVEYALLHDSYDRCPLLTVLMVSFIDPVIRCVFPWHCCQRCHNDVPIIVDSSKGEACAPINTTGFTTYYWRYLFSALPWGILL